MAVYYHDENNISLEELKELVGVGKGGNLGELPQAIFVKSRDMHPKTKEQEEGNAPYDDYPVYRCAYCDKDMPEPEFIIISRDYHIAQCPLCKAYQEFF